MRPDDHATAQSAPPNRAIPNSRGFTNATHERPNPPIDRSPERSPEHGDRSLAALLRELRDDAADLVQQEFNLARTEIAEEVRAAKGAVASSAVGASLLLTGLIMLAITASAAIYAALWVSGVDPLLAGWLAPLIVSLVVLMVGLVMLTRAKKFTEADHWRPTKTEQSLRETKRWAERKV